MVKISRPDLSNIWRELSKVMMKCTSFHYSLLLRALKYIEKLYSMVFITTLKIKLICHLIIINYGNYQYSLTHIGIVTLKIENLFLVGQVFLNNCIISWGSRGQKTISQSSTEAEIVSQNEAVRDILFLNKL